MYLYAMPYGPRSGRFGGSFGKLRADDLAAAQIKALMARHPKLDWSQVDEVYFGCANQAGEDNRNVARMALLLAALPELIPGLTLNRLCASGLDAVGAAGAHVSAGEIEFAIAGGVELMTRAPFVMGKAPEAFSRSADLFDTTMLALHQSLDEGAIRRRCDAGTGENVAEEFRFRVPIRMRSRSARSSAQARRSRRAISPKKSSRFRCLAARRADHRRQGRASASGNHARRLDKTEADRAQSRHGDRRQCVRRQ